MTEIRVTHSTREKDAPDHVRLRKFAIDDRHSLMFNSYGTIDFCDSHSCGVAQRISITDAKNLGAALLAAVSVYEQQPLSANVQVTNVLLDSKLRRAEQLLEQMSKCSIELRGAIKSSAI